MKEKYIEKFEHLGLGLFVHFGLYSILGKGEWYLVNNENPNWDEYYNLPSKFKVDKNWAKKLVKNAKELGAKYITITTRHHDGFSLYDVENVTDFSTAKTSLQRDLMKEFCDACHEEGIIPFFYHTLLDWHNIDYKNDFKKYIDFLFKSIEILCKNYGEIGGFWFDGYWDKPNADWRFSKLAQMIKKYQPNALVINNTGLSATGEVSHEEIDCVTFERGKTSKVKTKDRERAGEMCETFNDHWGYCKNDLNFKPIPLLIDELMECRFNNCNMLINTGLKGNGLVNNMDKEIMKRIGLFIRTNKNIIYNITGTNISDDDFFVLEDESNYYIYCKNVPMSADPNVQLGVEAKEIKITEFKLKNAKWLDNNKKCQTISKDKNSFKVEPYMYGSSFRSRILKVKK